MQSGNRYNQAFNRWYACIKNRQTDVVGGLPDLFWIFKLSSKIHIVEDPGRQLIGTQTPAEDQIVAHLVKGVLTTQFLRNVPNNFCIEQEGEVNDSDPQGDGAIRLLTKNPWANATVAHR